VPRAFLPHSARWCFSFVCSPFHFLSNSFFSGETLFKARTFFFLLYTCLFRQRFASSRLDRDGPPKRIPFFLHGNSPRFQPDFDSFPPSDKVGSTAARSFKDSFVSFDAQSPMQGLPQTGDPSPLGHLFFMYPLFFP